jgi:hypothetical protein
VRRFKRAAATLVGVIKQSGGRARHRRSWGASWAMRAVTMTGCLMGT